MICYICLILSALGTAALYLGVPTISPWWILPIALGCFVLFNAGYALYIVVSSFFLDTKKPIERPTPYCRFVIWLTMDWLMTLFRVRVTVKGSELLPDCPTVIVSNHRSAFDPLTLLAAMKKRHLVYICKESVMKIPFIGPYIYRGGFIGIDRTNGMRAYRALVSAAGEITRTGVDVGIYPEGTRSKDCTLLRFKTGAFVLAQKAHAPIVIATTQGTERAVREVFWKRTNVVIEIVEVIDAETVAAKKPDELAEYARSVIEQKLSK